MRFDLSQTMKMDQRMVLAPRMIQAMEILQLPLMALQERIEQELLSNPMLETEEIDLQDLGIDTTPEKIEGEEMISLSDKNSSDGEAFERLDNIGDTYDDYRDSPQQLITRVNSDGTDKKYEAMQNTAAPSQTLAEFLSEQWIFVEAEELLKKIGLVIIDNLEESGYLKIDLRSLGDYFEEKVTLKQLEAGLKLVQSLDPPGIGARDLSECLHLQLLVDTNVDNSLAIELVTKYLKSIEMNRFPEISRKAGRSIAEIEVAVQRITKLDPRPGMQVGKHDTKFITPEIIIEYDEIADKYIAKLTSGFTPNIVINKLYETMLKTNNMPEKTREYLQNNSRAAKWLIDSISQRKVTLLRVVNHVLEKQRKFFDHGPLYLKPLPMIETADVLGIHVGTVSRAVSGKYIQAPNGIFPLRYFFSGGRETSQGESVSWDAIRAKLQNIINAEDKSKPFNDDQLVEQLNNVGVTLARRTVAKYRGLMNIPPARRRKHHTE